MFDLTGRKALITGATGGLGEAIARALHAQGAIVGLHGTREEKLKELAAELGDRTFIFPANLSDREAVKALGQKAEEEMGGVDILVNNAGITRDGLFVRMSDEDWDAVLNVNLTSVFNLTRELTHNDAPPQGPYHQYHIHCWCDRQSGSGQLLRFKAGLIGFSKSLAQEIASRNVTVNCVAPGFIESAMTDKLNEKQKEAIMGSIPMKRMGVGGDIAAAVVYLASDEAAYVTGQTLHINGGMAMI